ncbi:hypothetical protein GZH47_09150 [Paenibacillus rhizovicinus]|uniref:Glycosyl hydrolase family 4 C-terminal domain-containing protein n=1 Tax=Paenibacillus rhizovicinus TaxID=2704463 RepID=A0A6C0P2X0_9BACL|nr:hypothetical protein [Paenibacillus rhizovicinus]QHW31002.1 hypothetical protein GZH47_09150 [Paenibacillus rhizovicinus]
MKIVLIGAGSYVFAPTVLEDAIVKHKLADSEIVLVDLNLEAVRAMAEAARRVSAELNVPIAISYTADRAEALPGADYVIVSASPQGAKRWAMDYEVLKNFGLADQARECGGLGGMLNAFRSITLIMDICRDMERLCPNARLLDVTNPMPRVVTAVERFSSIQGMGFCNIAHLGENGYTFLPQLLGRTGADVEIVTAGLNHFAWLLEMKDKATGEDLMPAIRQYVLDGDWSGQPEHAQIELKIMRRWLLEYGGIAAGSVHHHAEYLPVQADVRYADVPPYHGDESTRRAWMQMLQDIGAGQADWRGMFEHKSWEHPLDVALALHEGSDREIDIVNVPNRGCLQGIPEGRIVEVPLSIQGGVPVGVAVPALPEGVSSLCAILSEVHEMVAEAAVKGDRKLAHRTIDFDPAITDKAAAHAAFDRMIELHLDLLPQFAVQSSSRN